MGKKNSVVQKKKKKNGKKLRGLSHGKTSKKFPKNEGKN